MTSEQTGGRSTGGRPLPAEMPEASLPRSAMLPDLIWPHDMATGESIAVRRSEDPEAWERYAAADVPIVTQWDDGRHLGPGPGTVPTSSASMPSVVLGMLQALDVRHGHRVLEVGTGTGWNAGLIALRSGRESVVSVEIDPAVAEQARTFLRRAGLAVEVVTGDGTLGHPPGCPYDRVIATCGLRSIPYTWVQQCRPGAVIVAPWGTHFSHQDAVARLVVAADGRSASGRFVSPVQFMKARSQRLPPVNHDAYVPDGVAGADTSTTKVTEEELCGGDGGRFHAAGWALGLVVPRCWHAPAPKRDGNRPVWFYALDGPSWACVMFQDGQPEAPVWQSGPRRLWDEVETALGWWASHGRPGHERFGLTATAAGQRAWLDDPAVSWPV